MKNKGFSIKSILIAMLIITIGLNVAALIKSDNGLQNFIQNLLLYAVLTGLVLLISRQNQDDDDWAF